MKWWEAAKVAPMEIAQSLRRVTRDKMGDTISPRIGGWSRANLQTTISTLRRQSFGAASNAIDLARLLTTLRGLPLVLRAAFRVGTRGLAIT
jgi:hypothetical protein